MEIGQVIGVAHREGRLIAPTIDRWAGRSPFQLLRTMPKTLSDAFGSQAKFDVLSCVVTGIETAYINSEGKLEKVKDLYQTQGCLVVRGFGMVFVSDESKSFEIRSDDVQSIINNILNPIGYLVDVHTRESFEATATVFDNRAVIRSVEIPNAS